MSCKNVADTKYIDIENIIFQGVHGLIGQRNFFADW